MDPEDFPLYGWTVFPDESDAGTYFGVFWRFYLECAAADSLCARPGGFSDVRVFGADPYETYACRLRILLDGKRESGNESQS